MKAVKKPVQIDYIVWDGVVSHLVKWVMSFDQIPIKHFFKDGDDIFVKTLEGTSYKVPIGHIIIRGVNGEYYPCDPDIFDQTYSTDDTDDLSRYGRVNASNSLEELANVIRGFADEDGMIQGRKSQFNAESMAIACENYDRMPINVLTRKYGIRQQAMCLLYYSKIRS